MGLHCLLNPICPNTWSFYGSIETILTISDTKVFHLSYRNPSILYQVELANGVDSVGLHIHLHFYSAYRISSVIRWSLFFFLPKQSQKS